MQFDKGYLQLKKVSHTYKLTLWSSFSALVPAANTNKKKNNDKKESNDKEESKNINLPPCLEYDGTNKKNKFLYCKAWVFFYVLPTGIPHNFL